MKTGSIVLIAALLGSTFANPLLQRAACNADNCARALTGTANKPEATRSAHLADCSSFMSCTVTPAASTLIVTLTGPQPSTTIAPPSSVNSVAVTTCASATPSYASVCHSSAAFASACSCAGVTKTTSTAVAPTTTSYVIVYPSTSTYPAAADCTSVPAVLSGPDQPVTYKQYFSGSGVTLNQNNPGASQSQTRITTNYDGALSKCDAVSKCVEFAAYVEYYSFDLHYLKNTSKWECDLYFNGNKDTRYWNVYDKNVDVAYGYSL